MPCLVRVNDCLWVLLIEAPHRVQADGSDFHTHLGRKVREMATNLCAKLRDSVLCFRDKWQRKWNGEKFRNISGAYGPPGELINLRLLRLRVDNFVSFNCTLALIGRPIKTHSICPLEEESTGHQVKWRREGPDQARQRRSPPYQLGCGSVFTKLNGNSTTHW